jgi:hypothetical protein
MGYAFCFGCLHQFVPIFVPKRTNRIGRNPKSCLLGTLGTIVPNCCQHLPWVGLRSPQGLS